MIFAWNLSFFILAEFILAYFGSQVETTKIKITKFSVTATQQLFLSQLLHDVRQSSSFPNVLVFVIATDTTLSFSWAARALPRRVAEGVELS